MSLCHLISPLPLHPHAKNSGIRRGCAIISKVSYQDLFTLLKSLMSNLKVSVHWRNSVVHAGDEIECNITFKNTCPLTASNELGSSSLPGCQSGKETLPSFLRQSQTRKTPSPTVKNLYPKITTHRSTLSYGRAISARQSPNFGFLDKAVETIPYTNLKAHKRSISIVSIGDKVLPTDKNYETVPFVASRRPSRAHGGASKPQASPRVNAMTSEPFFGKQSKPSTLM